MSAPNCTHTMPGNLTTRAAGAERVRAVPYALRDTLALVLEILLWRERSRQRRHLGELSDHMLRDIGLSRADVWSECTKPFWRP
jgi:uncharacterized protein YjiS (DUF1127 family)